MSYEELLQTLRKELKKKMIDGKVSEVYVNTVINNMLEELRIKEIK